MHRTRIERWIRSALFRLRQNGLQKSEGLERLAISMQHVRPGKLQIQEGVLIISNKSRCFIKQLVRCIDFTIVPEADGQGPRRSVAQFFLVWSQSVVSTAAPSHLHLKSTLKPLLAVSALIPGGKDSLRITGGSFFTPRKLRQTLDVNEARAIPAARTPPHELRRRRFSFSFEANIAERIFWGLDLRLFCHGPFDGHLHPRQS